VQPVVLEVDQPPERRRGTTVLVPFAAGEAQ
jgi:hypothetical protein